MEYATRMSPYAAAVLGALLTVWVAANMARRELPRGLHLPGIALELATSPTDVRELRAHAPDVFATGPLTFDSFVVVPVNVLVLCGLGAYVASLAVPALGAAIAVCALLAGLFDEIENARLGVVIAASPTALTEAQVSAAYVASVGKWALLSVALALLAAGYWMIGDWSRLPAAAFAVSAVLISAGLAASPRLLEWGFGAMGVALLLAGLPRLVAAVGR